MASPDRYVALPSDAPTSGAWGVWDNKREMSILDEVNETEASVAAFAWNAIAEGRELVAAPLVDTEDRLLAAGYHYTGPTGGIPHE